MKWIYAIGIGTAMLASGAQAETLMSCGADCEHLHAITLPPCAALKETSAGPEIVCSGGSISTPDDRTKVELDELRARVEKLEKQMREDVITIQR